MLAAVNVGTLIGCNVRRGGDSAEPGPMELIWHCGLSKGGAIAKPAQTRTPHSALLAFAQCLARTLGPLAAAVPCAARSHARRLPTMILGPRRASLLAPSRNLFKRMTPREHRRRVMLSFRAAAHRKTIECSLFQSSIEVLRRPDSLQTACRQPDIGRYRRAAGELPLMAA